MSKKINIYDRATEALCGMLEEAGKDWSKPWTYTRHKNVVSNKPYRGVNIHLLNYTHLCSCQDPEDNREVGKSGIWGTFKQWSSINCKVKGQGSIITYFNMVTKLEKDSKGEEVINKIPIWKTYYVFGAEQVEGYEIPVINETNPDMQFEIAENYFSGTGAKLVDDDHAYYTPALDYIGMPKFEKFDSADSYYNTLFHELAHWTGHESRLDRNSVTKFKVSKFSDDYAYEELIAELGGMFNCLSLGIVSTPQKGNAQYINSWLGALKDNKRLVFRASKQAQQVVDYTDKLTESIEFKEAV